MRLTVGPLPASVYWRRRLLVLGMVALAVVVIVYSCGGDPSAGTNAPPGPTATKSVAASASSTPSPTPTPFTLPGNSPTVVTTGDCTDAEIELTATPNPADPRVGQIATFTLKVKNISSRTCSRNIGSIPQELQLRHDAVVIWSSDDCHPPGYNDYNYPEQFTPGAEKTFPIQWYGYRTRSDTGSLTCETTGNTLPTPANYELVARLGTKFSTPTLVTIRS